MLKFLFVPFALACACAFLVSEALIPLHRLAQVLAPVVH